MDMKDALIEVKEFSNDNNKLDESLIGLGMNLGFTPNLKLFIIGILNSLI